MKKIALVLGMLATSGMIYGLSSFRVGRWKDRPDPGDVTAAKITSHKLFKITKDTKRLKYLTKLVERLQALAHNYMLQKGFMVEGVISYEGNKYAQQRLENYELAFRRTRDALEYEFGNTWEQLFPKATAPLLSRYTERYKEVPLMPKLS